jgi:hypothetical protein
VVSERSGRAHRRLAATKSFCTVGTRSDGGEADRDGVICWPNQMIYKFSPQQIIGINHHYSTITKGSFNEDNVRLLLINLREFLQNSDNKNARGLVNANLLRELGDSVAHTVRTKGEIYGKIEVVQNEWGTFAAD